MSNAQTEARAIARFRIDWEHDDTGYPNLVRVWSDDGPFVSYDDHATALAAKDAELAAFNVQLRNVHQFRDTLYRDLATVKAQLAEANKALDELRAEKRSAWGQWERAQQEKERGR